ncbi:MAG: hypothetical protein FWG31_04140 [Oscillospiraceae bacterium]|nr:hypothetical protein [Oscillospiraceae bacterium]
MHIRKLPKFRYIRVCKHFEKYAYQMEDGAYLVNLKINTCAYMVYVKPMPDQKMAVTKAERYYLDESGDPQFITNHDRKFHAALLEVILCQGVL